MAGLIIAVPGIWLFLSTGTGACTLQAAAVCVQGYVLLTTTQIVGGALALAGITLIFTAAVLALRDQNEYQKRQGRLALPRQFPLCWARSQGRQPDIAVTARRDAAVGEVPR